jgi:hypothetical protein
MVIKVMEYSDTIFAHDIDYQVYIKPNPTIMGIKFFFEKNIVDFSTKKSKLFCFLKCKFNKT